MYTFKKNHPKVSILKPSLTILVDDNKDGVLNSPTTKMIKHDQWNHAGVFSISICAGFSLKMHEDAT